MKTLTPLKCVVDCTCAFEMPQRRGHGLGLRLRRLVRVVVDRARADRVGVAQPRLCSVKPFDLSAVHDRGRPAGDAVRVVHVRPGPATWSRSTPPRCCGRPSVSATRPSRWSSRSTTSSSVLVNDVSFWMACEDRGLRAEDSMTRLVVVRVVVPVRHRQHRDRSWSGTLFRLSTRPSRLRQAGVVVAHRRRLGARPGRC